MKSRIAIVAGLILLGAGLPAIGSAATATSGYSACSNTHNVLSVRSHGKCPKGTHKLTFDERGAVGAPGGQGPAGPSLIGAQRIYLSDPSGTASDDGPTYSTPISGVTIRPECDPYPSEAAIYAFGGSSVSITGSAVVDGGSLQASAGNGSTTNYFNPGAAVYQVTSTGYASLSSYSNTGPQQIIATFKADYRSGTSAFEVFATEVTNGSGACTISGQLIPTG